MSILSKKEIIKRIKDNSISFKPAVDEFQLKSHAIDMRLGYTFLIPKQWRITEKGREAMHIDHFEKDNPDYFDIVELEKTQHFELLPGEYVLASTLETIAVPDDLMAVLYPRSSTNRKGLSVDLTGIVDSGYEGQLAIPIRNSTSHQTIKLYPGERICQVVFETLSEPVEVEESRYHKKDIIEGFIAKDQSNKNKDSKEIKLIKSGEIPELKKKHKIL